MPETGKVLLFSFLFLFLDLSVQEARKKKGRPTRAVFRSLENFMRDGPVSQRTVAIVDSRLRSGRH